MPANRSAFVRVGILAEDANFASFLVPVVKTLARAASVPVRVYRPETTSGCQLEALRHKWAMLSTDCDLMIVGADSGGAWHKRKAATFRQKVKNLQQILGEVNLPVAWAAAHPSVEAWLLADAAAFRKAIEEIAGRFEVPAHWPAPRDEQDAKQRLARLVREATGDDLPRNGFEFAEEIVGHSGDLRESTSDSLAHFARDLV